MGVTLSVGQVGEFSKTISDEDVRLFAQVSGDHNPIHLDEAAGQASRFGSRIVHGPLVAGMIGSALAMRLPGPGTVYLTQSLKFVRPVRIGDTVTVRVEITEVIAAKGRVRLATTCRNQHGETVIDGEALVLAPDDATLGA